MRRLPRYSPDRHQRERERDSGSGNVSLRPRSRSRDNRLSTPRDSRLSIPRDLSSRSAQQPLSALSKRRVKRRVYKTADRAPAGNVAVKAGAESDSGSDGTEHISDGDEKLAEIERIGAADVQQKLRRLEPLLEQVGKVAAETRKKQPLPLDDAQLQEAQRNHESISAKIQEITGKKLQLETEVDLTRTQLEQLDERAEARKREDLEDQIQMEELQRRIDVRRRDEKEFKTSRFDLQHKADTLSHSLASEAKQLADLENECVDIDSQRRKLQAAHAEGKRQADQHSSLMRRLNLKQDKFVTKMSEWQRDAADRRDMERLERIMHKRSPDRQHEVRTADASLTPTVPHNESGPSTPSGQTSAIHDVAPLNDTPIEAWLRDLDGGRGTMLRYLEPIRHEFESLDTLRAAVLPEPASSSSLVNRIDPAVWEVIGACTMGHKFLIAKGILKLLDEYAQRSS